MDVICTDSTQDGEQFSSEHLFLNLSVPGLLGAEQRKPGQILRPDHVLLCQRILCRQHQSPDILFRKSQILIFPAVRLLCSSVSRILKLRRIKSFLPSSSSRDFKVLDNVGCVTCRIWAALVMFSSLATARKYFKVRISFGKAPSRFGRMTFHIRIS